MEVILTEDIQSLGKQGQVVKVAEGYARNFLLPKGKALEATQKNIAFWEKKKDQLRAKTAQEKVEMTELAKVIEEKVYTIKRKVGAGDKLYGSVTASDVAEALAEQGINIDRKKIQLTEPMKSLGEYSVPIRLSPEIAAAAKVLIVKDE